MTEEKQFITKHRECLTSVCQEQWQERWFFVLPLDSGSHYPVMINGNPVDTFKFHYFKPARPEDHPKILGFIEIRSQFTHKVIAITKKDCDPVKPFKLIYSFEYPKHSDRPLQEVNYTYSVKILLQSHSEGEAVAFYVDIETKVTNNYTGLSDGVNS